MKDLCMCVSPGNIRAKNIIIQTEMIAYLSFSRNTRTKIEIIRNSKQAAGERLK